MSLEDLQADLEANTLEAAALNGPLVTVQELSNHINGTMWPFIKNMVGEMEEMDEVIEDLYTKSEDILQPETAAKFAAVIVGATGLIMRELGSRLNPKDPKDLKVIAAIKEWSKLAKEAGDELEQITVQPPVGEEEPETEDDEEDDDDEDDDDADDAEGDDGDDDDDDDQDDQAAPGGK